ncbi:MAG: alpha/beta fold hydrolase [Actinomycetales bacterium]
MSEQSISKLYPPEQPVRTQPLSSAHSVDRFADVSSGTRICYREAGREGDPVIVLIAGLGEDLTFWGDSFVDALVGHGFRVVYLDNRDVGQSMFISSPPPATWRQFLAKPRADGYSLGDMARDVVGLLDHLGVDQVHLVGRSMGGMIAQTAAATHPSRVLSLTSIYSTTGAGTVGQPALSTMFLLLSSPPRSRSQAVRAHLRMTSHVAGKGYPIDRGEEAAIAARGWDRCAGEQADGVARQIQAIQRSGDRTADLRKITAATLVINGDRDLMVAETGGAATAAAIASARHVVIEGMGHHLPEALVATITGYVAEHAQRAAQR